MYCGTAYPAEQEQGLLAVASECRMESPTPPTYAHEHKGIDRLIPVSGMTFNSRLRMHPVHPFRAYLHTDWVAYRAA